MSQTNLFSGSNQPPLECTGWRQALVNLFCQPSPIYFLWQSSLFYAHHSEKGEVKIRQEKQIVDHRHPIPVATRSQYAVTMQEIKSKFKFFHLDRPLSTTANEWALSVTCGRKIDRCRCPLATFNNYTQLDCLLFGSQSSIQFQSVSQASESSQGSLKS